MLGPMVGRLGLGQSAIREIAGATSADEVSTQVVVHLRSVAILSVVSAPVVAWLATAIVQDGRGVVVALVILLIVLETVRLTMSDIYAALGRIGWSVAATHHVRSVIALLAMATVVAFQAGRTSLTVLLLVYAAVSCALLAFASVRLPMRPRLRETRKWTAMIVAIVAGSQLFAVELGAFLVGRGDVWLAGWIFPAEEALRYSTASVLAMQVTVIEGLANLAVAPVAARLWAQGQRDRVLTLLSASATVTTAVTLLAVAVTCLLAPQVLQIYGSDMSSAVPYLIVLAAGGIAMSVGGSCAVLLVITGKGREAAQAVGLVMFIALPAAVFSARIGGALALAIASATATIVLYVSYVATCRRALGAAPLPGMHLGVSIRILAGRPRPTADRPA
jgi:O-antigen/teichoic acid export membrane protein